MATLSLADQAVGRLDGIAEIIPNANLFVTMYVRKEAVLSSSIEGTQASLADVLQDEAGIAAPTEARAHDVAEVRNYVRALDAGLAKLSSIPLSLRLLKEIHKELLQGVRGKDKTPGEFRRSQNRIGPAGCTLDTAAFIPPPPAELMEHLGNLEGYLHAQDPTPLLIRAGIAHAQFEMIHPFLDGNGRLGRLLITFMLCEQRALRRPLLYLSAYFSARRTEYYDWLMRVREKGDWEGWIRFYLEGVETVATQAVKTAHDVLELIARDVKRVREAYPKKRAVVLLLEHLFQTPTVNVKIVAESLGIYMPAANAAVTDLVKLGILKEITGRERDRVFRYQEYLDTLTPSSDD